MSQRVAGTYSADRVSISIGLPTAGAAAIAGLLPAGLALGHAVDGRGTDAFLAVAREVATNSKTTGTDGEVVVSEAKNVSGAFTVTLMQSSVTNTVLSAMLATWEGVGGVGIKFFVPVTVVDLSSNNTLYEAEECWIQGWPEAGFGAAIGTLTWILDAGVLRMFHGSYGLVS